MVISTAPATATQFSSTTRINAWCFRSAWFVEQLESWRDNGDDGQLRKVMGTFARNASKAPNETLRRTVTRDQQIFKRIIGRPKGHSLNTCFDDLANDFDVSEDTVCDVYEAYRDYFDQETSGGVEPEIFFERMAEMLTRFPS